METIFQEAVKQVPAVVVAIVGIVTIVKYFLSHLKTMQEAWSVEQHERTKTLKEIGENCHSFTLALTEKQEGQTEKVVEAFDRNTEMLGRNMVALERTEDIFTRIEHKLDTL